MSALATTKLSSKGQVVIPEDIRDALGLKTGSQFVVVGQDDVIILKTLSQPSMNEFDSLIQKARKQAHSAGLKKSDVLESIRKVRSKKAK